MFNQYTTKYLKSKCKCLTKNFSKVFTDLSFTVCRGSTDHCRGEENELILTIQDSFLKYILIQYGQRGFKGYFILGQVK